MISLKIIIILFSVVIEQCLAFPISGGYLELADSFNSVPSHIVFLISGATLILFIYVVAGCVCCPNKSIKALSYQNGFPVSRLNDNSLQFENHSEFAIFPPQSTVIDLQPVGLPYPGCEDRVTFEPLPDILPRKLSGPNPAASSRPAHFRALLKHKVSLHDWFDDPNSNFPRDQLQYINELGSGWFGRVVEGEASHINNSEEKTKVIVKILREEATPSEHLHFLYEVRPYRDLIHPNVVRLMGRCLESDPFLLIMEHNMSDLKSFLLQQDKKDALVKNGILLRMAYNVAAGLRHLHKSGFTHVDMAAHNCFVCSDMTVKVGDYGISYDLHRGDYYCLGDIALPLRWYSPETLLCTETTIETKEVSKEANVWAFGVVLWEIFEFGKLPYENLSDEEVLQKVLIERTTLLPPLTSDYPLKDELFLIMRECWKETTSRPIMHKVENFLTQLYNDRHNQRMLESFEERWNSLQPKSNDSRNSSFKCEKDFPVRNDFHNYSSDGETFSSFDVSYDVLNRNMNSRLSPSLNVLNGSIDELTENDTCLKSISLGCERSSNDVVSVTSEKDISFLDDDDVVEPSGSVSPEEISSALMDLDLVLAAQSCANSRQSTLEHSRSNGITSFESDAHLSNSNHDIAIEIDNEFLYLDGNSNEMDPPLQWMHRLDENQSNFKQEVVTGSIQNGDINCNVEESHIITSLSTVPDIVVDEAPLLVESAVVENEDYTPKMEESTGTSVKTPRPFRFIFDTDSPPNELEIDSKNESNNNFDSEAASPPVDSNLYNRSHPLTSTPLKSNNDSNCCSEFVSELQDSGSVFRDSVITDESDILQKLSDESSVETSHHKDEQSGASTETSDSFYYETPYVNCEPRLDSLPYFSTKSTASLSNEENYTSAQSTLDMTEDSNISIPNMLSHSASHDENTESNLASTCSVTSATTCALPSHDGDMNKSKCPLETSCNSTDHNNKEMVQVKLNGPTEALTPEISVDSSHNLNNDKCFEKEPSPILPTNLSPSYEEALTPDLSFNSANDFKYSSADSTPFSLSESFSNSRAETTSSTSRNAFDQYIGSKNGFTQQQERNGEQFDVSPFSDEQNERIQSTGNLRNQKSNSSFLNYSSQTGSDFLHNDLEASNCNRRPQLCFHPYDEVIVEDLETGEQTVITENFTSCDDYENSGESDEILKIDTETDEAIIVDSSEALVGFVPSRSIELLQELPTLDLSFSIEEGKESNEDEKESSDFLSAENSNSEFSSPALKNDMSPALSPNSSYAIHQPFRNFCLQNEVIEEEITDEIATPSSIHSTASFSSNEIFAGGEDRMSESSESLPQMEGACETSVLPVMDHFYSESDEGSKTDISNSCSDDPNEIMNVCFVTDKENNVLPKENQDVMHSWQPTQSVRWNSDETLDIEEDMCNPVIIESQEILAGSNGITMEDITTALTHMNQLDCKMLDRLRVSPYSSTESSPCRDSVYTPDFESESDGESCSSTSGSFECIHNKFKDMADVTAIADESEASNSSREQSPMKVFSGMWDCHATPTRSVLVTPEKKFSSMRKSVSFHEEDPHVVFEYPPASYSSEEEEKYVKDVLCVDIDYKKYADWELQAGENDEIEEAFEIEELDSEPYVRRPVYPSAFSSGPLNRPMIYSLTSEFSDDDLDFTTDPINDFSSFAPPTNSPEEGKHSFAGFQMNEFICSQLNTLALEESRLQDVQNDLSQDAELLAQNIERHESLEKIDFAVEDSNLNSCENEAIVSVCELIDSDNSKEENSNQLIHYECKNLDNKENFHLNDTEIIKSSNEEDSIKTTVENLPTLESSKNDCDLQSCVEVKISNSIGTDDPTSILETDKSTDSEQNNENTRENDLKNDSSISNGKYPILCEDVLLQNLEFKPEIDDSPICKNNPKSDQIFIHEENCIDSHFVKDSHLNSLGFDNGLENVSLSENEKTKKSVLHKQQSSHEPLELISDEQQFSHEPLELIGDEQQFSHEPLDLISDEQQFSHEPLDLISDEIQNIKSISNFDCPTENRLQIENRETATIAEPHNILIITECKNQSHDVDLTSDSLEKDKVICNHQSYCQSNEVTDICNSVSGNSEVILNQTDLQNLKEAESESISHASEDFDSRISVPNNIQINDNRAELHAVEQQDEKESALNSKSVAVSDTIAETELLNVPLASALNFVPEIVITPASESEVEDEQDNYLLSFYSNSEEEFSVIPQYAAQPFKDLFGKVSENSTDYPEAFNFEFHSGDFFEDILDDYPLEMDNASPFAENSPNLGMIEKSSSEQTKFDTSPSYCSAGDTTHL